MLDSKCVIYFLDPFDTNYSVEQGDAPAYLSFNFVGEKFVRGSGIQLPEQTLKGCFGRQVHYSQAPPNVRPQKVKPELRESVALTDDMKSILMATETTHGCV